ncbi:hypothetical protein HBB16_11840 [Pseudonocardia sp. MCCB 268]|nr:hypothetical protein [Pseudonocardia cytotoxica]
MEQRWPDRGVFVLRGCPDPTSAGSGPGELDARRPDPGSRCRTRSARPGGRRRRAGRPRRQLRPRASCISARGHLGGLLVRPTRRSPECRRPGTKQPAPRAAYGVLGDGRHRRPAGTTSHWSWARRSCGSTAVRSRNGSSPPVPGVPARDRESSSRGRTSSTRWPWVRWRYGLDYRYLSALRPTTSRTPAEPAGPDPQLDLRRPRVRRGRRRQPTMAGLLRRRDCSPITGSGAAVDSLRKAARGVEAARRSQTTASPRISGWGHTTSRMAVADKLTDAADSPYVAPHLRRAIVAFGRARIPDAAAST